MNNWSFSSGMSKVRLNRCTFTYVMWLYIKKYLEFTRIIYVYAPCCCLFVVCRVRVMLFVAVFSLLIFLSWNAVFMISNLHQRESLH